MITLITSSSCWEKRNSHTGPRYIRKNNRKPKWLPALLYSPICYENVNGTHSHPSAVSLSLFLIFFILRTVTHIRTRERKGRLPKKKKKKRKEETPTGYKFREPKAEMKVSVGCGVLVGEALRSLCLCAVLCVLQGCPSALRLVWRRGSLWQANRDQLGSPAHKELRSRRLQPVCICRLLTSHLIALTHQLLLLRAGVIYLYTDFPQDEGWTNWARCVYLCVCVFMLD